MSVSMKTEDLFYSYPLPMPFHKMQSLYDEVPFNQVEKKDQEIKKKYDITPCFFLSKICDEKTRKQLVVNTVIYEAKKVLETMAIATAVGGTIGFVTGGIIAVFTDKTELPTLTYAGLKIGSGVGLAAGVGIGLYQAATNGPICITQSKEFDEWKMGLNKQQYDLFLNCLKKYSNIMEMDFKFVCSISYDIPTFPVVCPNGHVYEKTTIEEHLDKTWGSIQLLIDLKQRLIDLNPDKLTEQEKMIAQKRIEKQIDEQKATICPFKNKPFTKDDLVYASLFARDAIKKFKKLKNQLQVDPNEDPVLCQGLVKLLKHYQDNHKNVTYETISLLTKEILEFGATEDQRRTILHAYTSSILN